MSNNELPAFLISDVKDFIQNISHFHVRVNYTWESYTILSIGYYIKPLLRHYVPAPSVIATCAHPFTNFTLPASNHYSVKPLPSTLNVRQFPVTVSIGVRLVIPVVVRVLLRLISVLRTHPSLHGPLGSRLASTVSGLLEMTPSAADRNRPNLTFLAHQEMGSADHDDDENDDDGNSDSNTKPNMRLLATVQLPGVQ